ncbi:MAG: archaeosine tRNA-ribosyltransferase [Methanobacterium sp.]|nr:archaeosine tRNA-ribosyltransferase [Methanobacterium sp.]
MLEIMMHDGPARLGQYLDLNTPNILPGDSSLSLILDEPMPYNVPLSLAEFSVKKTIENAKESDETGIGVVQGSKYPELRVKCALELEKMGNEILMVAHSDELQKRPLDLLNIIINLRESIHPNTALYFPFVKIPFIPLLAYIGVDFFGDASNDIYADLGMLTTPHKIYDQKEYEIYQLNHEELRNYNRNTMDFVLREVRENIKQGTMRNLVEERCCSSPETMTALRVLDRDYTEFLDKYTPLY